MSRSDNPLTHEHLAELGRREEVPAEGMPEATRGDGAAVHRY